MSAPCDHLVDVTFEDFVAAQCPDCVAVGSRWVHLRQCTACGYVGCCDSSPNRHASRHAAENGEHPTVRSAEPGEVWVWCYVHERGVQP